MKCVIVYTSMTGNTEQMATAISEGIKEEGIQVDLKDSLVIFPEELLDYDGILLGCYTWNDGNLPDEFLDFYEEMNLTNLSGKIAAAFGSGDQVYPYFCEAVDILTKKLVELGAEVELSGLKIDQAPDEKDLKICKEFGKQFAKSFQKVLHNQ